MAIVAVALLIVVAFIVAVLTVGAWRAWQRAREHDRLTWIDIRRYLEMLLTRGFDGGFVIITDIPTDTFLQFAKYIQPGRDIGLRLGFPRAPWSEPHYPKLQGLLERRGVAFSIQPTGEAAVTEFLHVDCGRDIELALSLVREIFADVFGVPPERRLRLRGEGFNPKDQVVDRLEDG